MALLPELPEPVLPALKALQVSVLVPVLIPALVLALGSLPVSKLAPVLVSVLVPGSVLVSVPAQASRPGPLRSLVRPGLRVLELPRQTAQNSRPSPLRVRNEPGRGSMSGYR